MAERLVGYSQLQARFAALRGPAKMRLLAVAVQGELKRGTPRKTGTTARSWQVGSVGETTATVTGSIVNLWIDEGTGVYGPEHRRITPRAARALAFHAGPAGSLRLSGRPRAGRAGAAASLVVVRSVRGMRARPFIRRSVRSAVGKLSGAVVKAWDDAA